MEDFRWSEAFPEELLTSYQEAFLIDFGQCKKVGVRFLEINQSLISALASSSSSNGLIDAEGIGVWRVMLSDTLNEFFFFFL